MIRGLFAEVSGDTVGKGEGERLQVGVLFQTSLTKLCPNCFNR